MKKTFLVMKNELITIVKSPSYLIMAFGIPIFAVLILNVVSFIKSDSDENIADEPTSSVVHFIETEGYIDHSGLIQIIPDDLEGKLLSYKTEEKAAEALENGDISAYYIIPKDYLESGKVEYVYPDDKSFLSDGQQWMINGTLDLNMLGGDLELADLIWNPIWNLERKNIVAENQGSIISQEDCSRPGVSCESNEFIRLIPSIMAVFFFFAFMSSSSMLFQSIGVEKENRTIEMLLTSITPRQLLAGKTLGLGIAGLAQTVIWLGAIYSSLNLGGSTLNLPKDFVFPVEIIIWGLIFFMFGFGLYASLMAGAGALVPKMKEAGIANYIAMTPLFIGYIIGILAPLSGSAESNLVVFLSIFPFTSPIVIIMRLANGVVPFWQLLLSSGLLLVTAYMAINLVAAMFNAKNLLSGQPFSVKRYLRAFSGKS